VLFRSHAIKKAERLMCNGCFEKAIEEINAAMAKTTSCDSTRELLAVRSICKALLNDYEGAIQDHDQIPFSSENLIERALLDHLNGDREKGQVALLELVFSKNPPKNIGEWFLDFNRPKWDALIVAKML